MSYIDCFDHEVIGFLGNLPIYHPIENIVGQSYGHPDFSATTANLILGGGSGEHPALVIHKLELCVALFLMDQVENWADFSKEEHDYLIDALSVSNCLEFCGWTVRNYADLLNMSQSPFMTTPLKENEMVENWLAKSIGELVYYCLPELNPEKDKLSNIFSRFEIQPNLQNVRCLPPSYPALGGRKIVDGKLVWGLNRW